MQRVSFRVEYPPDLTHPLHREVAASDAVSRAELLVWGPVGAATQFTWFDADRDAVATLLDAVDAVDAVQLVADEDGTYAFTRQSGFAFADELLDRLAAAHVAFLPPVVFHEDGTARFDAAGEQGALGALHDSLADLLDVSIDAVHDFHRGGAPATLTDRQHAALRAGVVVGYYDVPRTGSVADVARALDCAHSTAGELLRKAEARAITDLVDP